MNDRHSKSSGIALIALLLAGCGSSDDTTPATATAAPAPVAASPASLPSADPASTPNPSPGTTASAPGATAAPDPATAPARAAPGPTSAAAEPPAAGPPAAVPPAAEPPAAEPPASLSGSLVWAALLTGISDDPAPQFPTTNYRKVSMPDGSFIHLGGASGSVGSTESLVTEWGLGERRADVRIIGSDGVIDAVSANGLDLTGPQLDLRNVDPSIGATAGTWVNNGWSASLVVQSADELDLIRVCWDVNLPAMPTYQSGGVPDEVPIKRLMCGLYSEAAPGPDVGGYVEDNYNGIERTFRGSWPENAD